MNKLISVIIPNYCHSRFLDLRIKSVLDQTYRNIEVIILDDCSPDNGASRAVIEKYRKNPFVSHIVYNDVNTGNTFLQWKKGIELSKGEIIWIAESDDFCDKNMLEELLKAFLKHKDTAISFTTYKLVDENGLRNDLKIKKILSIFHKYLIRKRFYSGSNFNIKCQLLGNRIQNASTAIFSKDAYNKMEKDFINYKSAGDYLFWVRLAEYGSVVKLYKGLSYFRRHGNVVTYKSDANGDNFIANKKIMLHIKNKYHISSMRWKIAVCHQKFRIKNIKFLDEQIANKTQMLWSEESESVFIKNLYSIYLFIIRIFDLYF